MVGRGVVLGVTCALASAGAVEGQTFGTPVEIAPGVVSEGNAWRGAPSPDGSELYLFRSVGPNEDYRIYVSRRAGDSWGPDEPISFHSDEHSELYPVVSPDGQTMVLTSYRPVDGLPPNSYVSVSRKTGDEWSTPEIIRSVNEPGRYHAQPYFDGDGGLIFRRPGPGGAQLFRAPAVGDGWGTPVEIDYRTPFADQGLNIVGYFEAPSGCWALLTVEVERGNVDLYSTRRAGEGWSSAEPVAGLNTPGMDLFPVFEYDDGAVWFVRDFGRLYRVEVSDAPRC